MRYTILFILSIVLVGFTGCKQDQAVDQEKERKAIIAVINQETDAYMRLTAGADNYTFYEGWEVVGKHLLSDETEDNLSPDLHISVEKSNYRMKIYPSSAFVVCDQKWTSEFGDDVTEINSIQVRFLEKIEGEWKISFVSWIGTSGYNDMEETEELFD